MIRTRFAARLAARLLPLLAIGLPFAAHAQTDLTALDRDMAGRR
jgi:hypothetical protein